MVRSDLENQSSTPGPAAGTSASSNENMSSARRHTPLSAWEVLGAVSTFKHNVERMRWYKSSISTIKFLSILNITYTVVGVVFLFLSMFPTTDMNFNYYQKQHFFRLGIFISIFSPVALVTDLLALRGLRQWKRNLLIPWLILYGILIALAFAVSITELYHRGIRWPLLLLAFCSLLVFSRWRHLSLQYKLMGIYTEPPSERNIGQLADDIRIVTDVELRPEPYPAAMAMPESDFTMARKNSLPPKYEDLDQPPKYDEQMFLASSQLNDGPSSSTPTGNAISSSTDEDAENNKPDRN